jgi:porphyrinogen peroxidase
MRLATKIGHRGIKYTSSAARGPTSQIGMMSDTKWSLEKQMTDTWDRVTIEPQSIVAPLSNNAIFLVVGLAADPASFRQALAVIANIGGLVRAVGFRDLDGRLSCNVGIGSAAWDRLGRAKRPAQLRTFSEIRGAKHTAPATPGDLFFHIRAERADMCFELERLLLDALGDTVAVIDEVQGFRYFDARDLLGFVDGTENPTGDALRSSSLIQGDDPDFESGSYVVVQKYLHNLGAWNSQPVALQESIVGRTKLDNIELDDSGKRKSHKSLTTIVDAQGTEHDILRDNMPFGRPGQAEYGTYFIGYARNLWVIERMLQNMFIGVPPGDYDRILDFSTPVTGTTFFAPSNSLLEVLAD